MISRHLAPLLLISGLAARGDVKVTEVIETYCSGCHNGTMRSPSGVLLDRFDATRISANPDMWARAYRQLQAGTMPPVSAPRPDRATYDAVLGSIEQALSASLGGKATVDSREIANRLARLLWNSAPDEALLQAARQNGLNDAAAVGKQVQRMIADDRTQAFVS